jgi:hypothetical protein
MTYSKIQKSAASSSTEAEIIALSNVSRIVVYYRRLLKQLLPQNNLEATKIYVDSQPCINTAKHDRGTPVEKHIDISDLIIKDYVQAELISLTHVPTKMNIADHVTKISDKKRFIQFKCLFSTADGQVLRCED